MGRSSVCKRRRLESACTLDSPICIFNIKSDSIKRKVKPVIRHCIQYAHAFKSPGPKHSVIKRWPSELAVTRLIPTRGELLNYFLKGRKIACHLSVIHRTSTVDLYC